MAQPLQEQILFQYRTRTDGNEFVWQCPEFYTALLYVIVITNVTGNAITYRFFVNPNGRTIGIENSLGYDVPLAGNAPDAWSGFSGVMHPTSFGIQSSAAEAIVMTCFGSLLKTG